MYGWRELRNRRLAYWPENRWVDRVPIWRGDGRKIVFADKNAVYAVSVDGTKLRRPVREDTAVFHVGGRWRYVLKGFTSLDVSNVDGALVYATCWSYSPDGSDPEIARCAGPGPVPQDCFQKPAHSGKVRLAFPSGDVEFDIGDDLYELTVVRPDGTRLAFAQANGDRLHLYTMAADGTQVRQITAAPGAVTEPGVAWVPGLAWSPDGSRLLYRCFVLVCVVGLGGQMVGEFAEPYLDAQIPAWSADGRRIVLYNAAEAGRDKVVLTSIAPDGSDGRVLVREGAGGGLVAEQAWRRRGR